MPETSRCGKVLARYSVGLGSGLGLLAQRSSARRASSARSLGVAPFFPFKKVLPVSSDITSSKHVFYLLKKGFFKFKFIYFNWRLITLQYYIGFAIH